MTLYFADDSTARLPLAAEALAETVIRGALTALACPYEAEVNLLLTNDSAIQTINRDQRGIDRPTDVLSFPANEFSAPGDFTAPDPQAFDPENGEWLLGDIVISTDRVLSQAAEYGHSVKREYAFLIVHSVLHLVGYDHLAEDERILMEAKQKELLDILDIRR